MSYPACIDHEIHDISPALERRALVQRHNGEEDVIKPSGRSSPPSGHVVSLTIHCRADTERGELVKHCATSVM